MLILKKPWLLALLTLIRLIQRDLGEAGEYHNVLLPGAEFNVALYHPLKGFQDTQSQ